MKRISRKILINLGVALLALGIFVALSLSDVVRLNAPLEGVPNARLVQTAKETDVTVSRDVLLPVAQLPEGAETKYAVEAPLPEPPEGETLAVSGTTYTLIAYEELARAGGALSTDKFGALKTLEYEGAAYYPGKVTYTRNLWDGMDFLSKAGLYAAFPYVQIALILGALLLLAGFFLQQRALYLAARQPLGAYVKALYGRYAMALVWGLALCLVFGAICALIGALYCFFTEGGIYAALSIDAETASLSWLNNAFVLLAAFVVLLAGGLALFRLTRKDPVARRAGKFILRSFATARRLT